MATLKPIFSEKAWQQYNADPLRQRIDAATFSEEATALTELIDYLGWDATLARQSHSMAQHFVETIREKSASQSGLQTFMLHYDLSCAEGVLLMCLAEALLRTPDKANKLLLIQDKIGDANWSAHRGKSTSSFVNMATLGLIITGSALSKAASHSLKTLWQGMIKRLGGPVIRDAITQAMTGLSTQFVLGQTIEEAIKKTEMREEKGHLYSYDMLGEAACTMTDADRYWKAYQHALEVVGQHSEAQGSDPDPKHRGGISIKLSSLHPRYEYTQQDHVVPFLIEKVTDLCLLAKKYNCHVIVDAEECDRLDMSLQIIQAVFEDPRLTTWEGFGMAVQAYQKRAFYVIDWVDYLANKNNKRMILRLVKGAYWDSEIKKAQQEGASDYPVYTRKPHTDVAYLACAKKMLAYPKSMYCAFATHNALTIASLLHLMDDPQTLDFEWQNLQGMGDELHDMLIKKGYRSRVYAPVGTHEDLLPYLVRRLLENGANSSFINQIHTRDFSIEQLLRDPVDFCKKKGAGPHPHLPKPRDLFGDTRLNASSYVLSHWSEACALQQAMEKASEQSFHAKPISVKKGDWETVFSPSTENAIGQVHKTQKEEVDNAFAQAQQAWQDWHGQDVDARALCLEKTADLLEKHMGDLVYLIASEAGRTLQDGIDDVREAVDFCRYYAVQARRIFACRGLPGPTGESNVLGRRGRGVMICISPWNFPAAIFTGQVAAALVAGNGVLAKPAEQTPLTAAFITDLFYQAGIPKTVLQCITGDGELGAYMVSDLAHQGVIFTGSNEAAWSISQSLASKRSAIVPLIAETGGMNALLADSTALPEQLVQDVMLSAFGSAGQRCSALRVLLIQEEMADRVINLLQGALACLQLGNPMHIATDVGPVIDNEALGRLQGHIASLEKEAHCIGKAPLPDTMQGHFVAPQAYEIARLDQLKGEVFGPILHVMRYKRGELDNVIDQINAWGYGLTFGVHSRINTQVDAILNRIHAGNLYVNRSMTGAVVGVQPFGGSGLSGSGPKAGGPDYLLRLTHEVCISVNTTAAGGNASLMMLES